MAITVILYNCFTELAESLAFNLYDDKKHRDIKILGSGSEFTQEKLRLPSTRNYLLPKYRIVNYFSLIKINYPKDLNYLMQACSFVHLKHDSCGFRPHSGKLIIIY